MDGGSITVLDNNKVQTVWRRELKIYASEPGKPEIAIGEGRGCTISSLNNETLYAWSENGLVVCLLPKIGKVMMGKGRYPVMYPIGNDKVICVWENEKNLFSQVVQL